jgi:hypothetical protein
MVMVKRKMGKKAGKKAAKPAAEKPAAKKAAKSAAKGLKIPAAKAKKFADKEYKQLDEEWEIDNHQTSMTFAAEEVEAPAAEGAKVSTVAGYIVDVQVSYDTEDKAYACFAEFFKIAKKQVDYKAYQVARKDAEEGADEEEGESPDEMIPKYSQKEYEALPLGKKFGMLEPYLDMVAEFDIEMEDVDGFKEALKQFNVELPDKVITGLKA